VACSPRRSAPRAVLLLAAMGVVGAIAGCVPVVTTPPAPSPGPAIPHRIAIPPAPKPPSPTALANDTLLVVTGHVTADNGATANVTAVVHAPLDIDDQAAAPMLTAMTSFCAGEVDRGALLDVDARLVRVDVRSTLLSGTWPIDLPVALGPDSTSAFVTADAGGVFQEQVLPAHPGPADYVPRCAEPAFLTIGRSGSVYLAEYIEKTNNIGLDNASFWGHLRYGFATPYNLFTAQRVTFDHCGYTLTALGTARLGTTPTSGLRPGPTTIPGSATPVSSAG
jgi:hypothetical protein